MSLYSEKKNNNRRILFLVLALLFCVIIAEIVVRQSYPVSFSRTWFEYDTRGFKKNVSGITGIHYFNNKEFTYSINSLELRGQEPNPTDSTILLLGDGFVFGMQLNEDKTLDQHLNNTELGKKYHFLNGGVFGAGFADQYYLAKHYVKQLEEKKFNKPKAILVILNNQTVIRSLQENLDVLTADSVMESRRFESKPFKAITASLPGYYTLMGNSKLLSVTENLMWYSWYYKDLTHNFDASVTEVPIPTYGQLSAGNIYSEELMSYYLKMLKTYCDKHEIQLLLTTSGLMFAPEMDVYTESVYPRLDSLTALFNIPYLDVSEQVKPHIEYNLTKESNVQELRQSGELYKIVSPLYSDFIKNKMK